MTEERRSESLDICENLTEVKKYLHRAGSLIEFFSDGFNEERAHDDSRRTRRKLQTARTTLIKDLNNLCNVLSDIDLTLVFEWDLRYW